MKEKAFLRNRGEIIDSWKLVTLDGGMYMVRFSQKEMEIKIDWLFYNEV